jgi:hypothetical protein
MQRKNLKLVIVDKLNIFIKKENKIDLELFLFSLQGIKVYKNYL